MFITRSIHCRNTLGVVCDGNGLGLVVRQTTKFDIPPFDPTYMKNREKYWLDIYTDNIFQELLQSYKDAGYDIRSIKTPTGSGYTGPIREQAGSGYRSAVSRGPVGEGRGYTTGRRLGGDVLGFIPGIPMGRKRPIIAIEHIREEAVGIALPYAKKTAYEEEQNRVQEEEQRIQMEKVETEQQRQAEITRKSVEATSFKLPEGVVGIRRGALEMKLKGGPVEVRIPAKKK